jgi:acylphosphatase
MKRLIAHVSGKVKGVGYSSIVVTLARTLDLKGYVEILPDGKAFIIAEGPKVDLARFVSAIRIDNAKIRVEGILIDCREATGEFDDFHKILPRQVMQLQPFKESMIDNFLQAPAGLERVDREISRTNHKLKRAGSGLERQEDAIELSREETLVPGSGRPLPGP